MSADFAAVENAWLTGYVRFEQWRMKDEERFFRPLMQSVVALHYNKLLADPMLPQIKAADPELWARYESFVQGIMGTKSQEVSGA